MSEMESGRGGPFEQEQRLREQCIERFETAWCQGRCPSLEDFLPEDPHRVPVLVELVHIDLERRLKAGDPARVENYLDRYPDLVVDAGIAVELIVAEYSLRRRWEPDLSAESYLKRFPQYAEFLRAALPREISARPMPKANLPSPNQADANLLFGILALQLSFIGRDQLLAAARAWAADKSQSIEQRLLAQGVLGPEKHALLGALVTTYLGKHEYDFQKSLALLSSLGSVRDDLQAIGDAELQECLKCVATATHLPTTEAQSFRLAGDCTSRGRRFRVLRPHAKGGLGEVSVAYDEELHREVALKEIQSQHVDHPESRSRFLLEAEITGRLEHPGIVPVYGLGTYADGRPFYAMRFIQGDSMQEAIAAFHGAATPRDRTGWMSELRKLLRRFVDVCNAIQYAHSRGVLHRDLKPGNIILGEYGETLVVDWGLAKVLGQPEAERRANVAILQPVAGNGTPPTELGRALGTPAFMSPEQATGHHEQLGPATDVYGLGATLYILLTGKPPYSGASLEEIRDRICRGDALRPRQAKPEIPPPLEAACLKAMALRPGDRYASAGELAEDIERWMADEPTSAYRETILERSARTIRRHRTVAASGIALLVAAVLALSIGVVLVRRQAVLTEIAHQQAISHSRRAETARAEAETRRKKEVQAREEIARQLHRANAYRLVEVSKALRSTSPDRSLLLAIEAVQATHRYKEPLVPGAQPNLLDAMKGFERNGFRRHRVAPPNKNRSFCAFADSWLITDAGEDTLQLQDPANPMAAPVVLRHGASIIDIAASPDMQLLATASNDGKVRVWDLNDKDPSIPMFLLEGYSCREPDSGSKGGSLSSGGGPLPQRFPRPPKLPCRLSHQGIFEKRSRLSLSPDHRWLIGWPSPNREEEWWGKESDAFVVWDLAAPHPSQAQVVREAVGRVYFSPDGRWLATGSIGIGATEDCEPYQVVHVRDLQAHDPWKTCAELRGAVAFSENGRRLATGTRGEVLIWDLETPDWSKPSRVLKMDKDVEVVHVVFSPNAKWLYAQASDQSLLWNLWEPREDSVPSNLSHHIMHEARFSSKSDFLVACDLSGILRVWRLPGHGCFCSEYPSPDYTIHGFGGLDSVSMHVELCDKGILGVNGSTGFKLWDMQHLDQKDEVLLEGFDCRVSWCGMSCSGDWLHTVTEDGAVHLWDFRGWPRKGPESDMSGWAPNAWRTALGDLPHTTDLQVHLDVLEAGVMARYALPAEPDLKSVVGDDPKIIDLLREDPDMRCFFPDEPDLWTPTSPFRHKSPPFLVSADGRWLVAQDLSRNVCRWDLSAKAPSHSRIVLTGDTTGITAGAISVDGQRIARADAAGAIRIWDCASPETVQQKESISQQKESIWSQLGRIWLRAIDPSRLSRVDEASLTNGESTSPGGEVASPEGINTSDSSPIMVVKPMNLPGHQSAVKVMIFSPNGQLLITAGDDHAIRLLDLAGKHPVSGKILEDPEFKPEFLAMTPDQRWLLSNGARAWERRQNRFVCASGATGGSVNADFPIRSPDGRWEVKSGTVDKAICLHALDTQGRPLPPVLIRPAEDRVSEVHFTPDSRWLLTASDRSGWLWHPTTDPKNSTGIGTPIRGYQLTLRLPWGQTDREKTSERRMVGYHGRWTIASHGSTVAVELSAANELIDIARRLVGRDLTPEERRLYNLGDGVGVR